MLGLLEHEREKRREECRVIGKSVRELEGVWRGVERVIVDTLGDVVVNSNATSKSAVSLFVLFRIVSHTCAFGCLSNSFIVLSW